MCYICGTRIVWLSPGCFFIFLLLLKAARLFRISEYVCQFSRVYPLFPNSAAAQITHSLRKLIYIAIRARTLPADDQLTSVAVRAILLFQNHMLTLSAAAAISYHTVTSCLAPTPRPQCTPRAYFHALAAAAPCAIKSLARSAA